LVTAAQHLGEGLHLLLAATLFARLLVVALGANTLDDVLAVELLLHATDRTINRLIFADFDFDSHVGRTEGDWKSGQLVRPPPFASTVFFAHRPRAAEAPILQHPPPLPPPNRFLTFGSSLELGS